MSFIPNCIPSIAGNEKKYLNECIDTGWLSSVGPFVDKFESEFAKYHSLNKAVAVSSGTAAIHLGLLALGVKKDDIVLSSDITFVGGVNPIKYCGADPLFLPVEESTLNISPKALELFIETSAEFDGVQLFHKETKRRISCIIITHLYGIPCNMDELLKITKKFNIKVLEDAAESLGAKYNDKLVGTFGDIGCFSFNGNKVITSGGGGMLISKNESYLEKCKHLSTQAKTSKFGFIHDQVGFNYRMSNVCAAVGLAQFEKLDDFIEKKIQNFTFYKENMKDEEWSLVESPENTFATYWMVLIKSKILEDKENINKAEKISDSGIGIRPVWFPLHLMDLYKQEFSFNCNQSIMLFNNIFCLPSSVGITKHEMLTVIESIRFK